MATGSPLTTRARETDDVQDQPAGGRRPGLTPASLFIVLVLFWLLIQMGSLLVTALMAILLGTLLEGPVRRIQERRIPRPAAIAMVYVFVIGAVALLIVLIVPVVQDQFDTFQTDFPATVRELRDEWSNGDNALLSGPGVSALGSVLDFFDQPGQNVEVSGQTAEQAIPILQTVGGAIVSVITALVVTFYYLLEKSLIRRLIIEQVPDRHRTRVDQLWTSVEQKTGGWLRGQLLLCLIIGTIATTAYGIIGLSFWPLLGLWAGITEIIPIVGPWIGGIPAVIVALTEGPETALIVAAVIVGMQSLENWFLVPRVMRGAVGLTPMTVFVAILAGTELMGIAGAVLAIPIAAGVQVILTDLIAARSSRNAGQSQMSGWRWMLNRGMGRANAPYDDGADLGEQVEGPSVFHTADDVESGDYSEWGRSPAEPAPDDPERIDTRAESTWPANPWKGKVPAAKRASTWRGMDRANVTRGHASRERGVGQEQDTDAPSGATRREDSTK